MTDLSHNYITEGIHENAIFIIGAGYFGSRAAHLLNQESNAPLFVLDTDHGRLSELADLAGAAEKLTKDDGGQWLLGTSCKCHGILTALEIEQRKEVT